MRYADIHGESVVFSSEGDLWLGDLKSRRAQRLTSDAGSEVFPRFSPDGTQIAFMAEYDGVREAYVMPTAGGSPRRLTYHYAYATVQGWNNDGTHVVYRTTQQPEPYDLKMVPAKGGAPVDLPTEFGVNVSFSEKEPKFAFTRFNRATTAWFHYIGGMQNQVWVGDIATKQFKQITDVKGTNEYPCWVGDDVYFANMQGSAFTLMRVPSKGGKATKVAGPFDVEVRDLNSDGSRVIYQKGEQVEVFDPSTGKATAVNFEMSSDLPHMRPVRVPVGSSVESYSLTKTGKRVLVESRGQIVDAPAGDGAAVVWMAKDGVRLREPRMSPDATKVAYISDESGEQQLYVAKADGSEPKQITNDSKRRLVNYAWSPDGKHIALNDSESRLRLITLETGAEKQFKSPLTNWGGISFSFSPDSKHLALAVPNALTSMRSLALYEIETGTETKLGNGMTDDFSPEFTSDGKYLAFISQRNFAVSPDQILNQLNTSDVNMVCLLLLHKDSKSIFLPENTKEEPPKEPKEGEEKKPEEKKEEKKIDVEGLYDRLVLLPMAPGGYSRLNSAGSRLLIGGGGSTLFYDLSAKSSGTLSSGFVVDVSADGKKVLMSGMRVIDANGKDVPNGTGRVDFGGLTLRIDPPKEWRQIYWDAWRFLRDYFYVANMHGVDWDTIGKKYAASLPRLRSRDELDELIRWMQAELGSSHQYLAVGDTQDIKPRTGGSYLGADLVPDSSGYYKIEKILRGDGILNSEMSPLAEPGLGVKEGDFLIDIAGTPAKVGSDFLGSLASRAGKTVALTVNDKPSAEGARTIYVKPVGNEARMRLVDWIAKNKKYVDEKSGGKVGYVYLAAMGNEDVSDFIRQFYPQRDKEALLIDTRFNNGGWVQSIIIDILDEKLSGFFNMRGGEYPWSRQGDWYLGPKACLVNEFNVSCGEEFPHRWRDLGLGPIIGRRTYGGEVGSSPGWRLVDGGTVYVPNYGMYTLDGKWAIEGEGVLPDIDVPSDPNLFVKGIDPQMDRAIQYLLEEVKKHPRPDVRPPKDRVRVGKGE